MAREYNKGSQPWLPCIDNQNILPCYSTFLSKGRYPLRGYNILQDPAGTTAGATGADLIDSEGNTASFGYPSIIEQICCVSMQYSALHSVVTWSLMTRTDRLNLLTFSRRTSPETQTQIEIDSDRGHTVHCCTLPTNCTLQAGVCCVYQ